MNLGILSPYASAIRIGVAASALAAVAAFGVSWHQRGQQIEKLETWQGQVVRITREASGDERLKADDVVLAVAAVGATARNCATALGRIDADARAAKDRSDARDAALRSALAEERQRYKAAENRIANLDRRVPSATAAESAERIEDDSKAAWEGWAQ